MRDKIKYLRNIGFLLLSLGFILAIFLILNQNGIITLKSKSQGNPIINEPALIIDYPFEKTIFPRDIASPTFIWRSNRAVKNWKINLIAGDQSFYSSYIFNSRWKPDSLIWEGLKIAANIDSVTFCVSGQFVENDSIKEISGSTGFIFSTDSVKAPVFFRQVDLPFSFAKTHITTIEWRIGSISDYQGSKVLLSDNRICANCHSFSQDGSVMGMDIDLNNNKGGYATFPVEKNSKVEKNNIFSWNNVSLEKNLSSGFLSSLSPNGRYVLGTINDFPLSSFQNNGFRFFPVKGILGVYDRHTGKSWELQGANDTSFVQCNATWSPDGNHIIFAKAPSLSNKDLNDTEKIRAYAEGEIEFCYDLWSIPFNEGKGGQAKPIMGASGNGKSNYFPRVSPDGKWIVFTQAHSYMLRQLDSRLLIIPFEGGDARELASNMASMNSWHTWSPNGKWLAFSTKGFSTYTKIALTHIDSLGRASMPVLLENMVNDSRAANIPEFVNIKFADWNSVSFNFLEDFIIRNIVISDVKDGSYSGTSELIDANLNLLKVSLDATIINGAVTNINIIEPVDEVKYAEVLISKILSLQSMDLNILGVQSNEERLIVKALEQALIKGLN